MSRTLNGEIYGSKAFDPSCRNHGGCPWCFGNRTFQAQKEAMKMDYSEYLSGSGSGGSGSDEPLDGDGGGGGGD